MVSYPNLGEWMSTREGTRYQNKQLNFLYTDGGEEHKSNPKGVLSTFIKRESKDGKRKTVKMKNNTKIVRIRQNVSINTEGMKEIPT